MQVKILILIFWLSGMISLGIATSIISRSVRGETKEDRSTARHIAGWGMIFEVAWFVYGGVIVFAHLTGK
jgi:hypothetical protein